MTAAIYRQIPVGNSPQAHGITPPACWKEKAKASQQMKHKLFSTIMGSHEGLEEILRQNLVLNSWLCPRKSRTFLRKELRWKTPCLVGVCF